MLSTGIDIESIARVSELTENGRSLNKVFTEAELRYSASKRVFALHLAGRFAAKEACAKAFKTGFGSGLYFKDIEVVRAPGGRPELKLSPKAAELLGDRRLFLSIAYAEDIAAAIVIISPPAQGAV